MQVKEIMRLDPHCCTRETDLVQVAAMMKECDCGAIPVVDDMRNRRPVGIITDRDIAIRAVAEDMVPSRTKAKDCMTHPAATIEPEASLEECARTMEEKQIRRLVVVDENGRCCGIVVQAQMARKAPKEIAAELLREISEPAPELS